MDWKITLSQPSLDERDYKVVEDVLRSGWLTMGPKVAEFEKLWCDMTGSKHAFAVSSGTAALHLAFLAPGIGPGDEVICPALTFVASANAARYIGADVVFADAISPYDLNISPDSIKACISPKTKAIIVMHYGGYMCDMENIQNIAKEHDLKIIEDAAHAPLASWVDPDGKDHYAGTIGECGAFSFYGNKNITTGEGGMVTTNSDTLAEKIRLYRSHGMTSVTFERHNDKPSAYDIVETGYNYRMDDIRAALGISQLNKLDDLNRKRRRITQWYREALIGIDNVIVPFIDRDVNLSACHLMAIVIKKNYQRVVEKLTEASIQTSRHYIPVPKLKEFENCNFEPADKLINNILTLPLHPKITKAEIMFIAQMIAEGSA